MIRPIIKFLYGFGILSRNDDDPEVIVYEFDFCVTWPMILLLTIISYGLTYPIFDWSEFIRYSMSTTKDNLPLNISAVISWFIYSLAGFILLTEVICPHLAKFWTKFITPIFKWICKLLKFSFKVSK